MISTLFAYGTLQHPDIISFVLGRVPESVAPAVLNHFARYAVQGEDFPGIVKESGSCTDGTLFMDIRPEEWERLDSYESDLYERQSVSIVTMNGNIRTAYAYVVPPEHQYVLSDNLWEIKKYKPNPQP